MLKIIAIFFAGFMVLFCVSVSFAQPVALAPEQWREDLGQLENAIRTVHPAPFRAGDEETFTVLVNQLTDEIDTLSDKQIIVRLTEIVATLHDGHTRLSLPRQHPELALEFGHKPTPVPEDQRLWFKQFPLAFEQFTDGIFIVAASVEYKKYIGWRVEAIDDIPAANAMKAVQRITFAENPQLQKLMGADRLSMPEVLVALEITKNDTETEFTLTDQSGAKTSLAVNPLSTTKPDWISAPLAEIKPVRLQIPDAKFWSRYLPEENIVYAQINEIADTAISLAQFSTEIIAEAEKHDAKLVIDLRNNFGGSNDLNRTLEMALVRSDELNQYGRTFVLTGRRTFSAAQSLVNFLEKYTRALFVGEATGAKPDHYGDPKKIRLKNSGLTLRVSALHWSSPYAHDDREATEPDLAAPWSSTDYFSGADPAMKSVINYQNLGLQPLLRSAIGRGDQHLTQRYLVDAIRSPDSFADDLSQMALDLADEFITVENAEAADLVLQYGLYLYPDNVGLKTAYENLSGGDQD